MTREELNKFTDRDGDINLSGKTIDSLPEDLHVKGTLNLFMAKITELPSGLKVDGDLNFQLTNICSLPHHLQVGSDLVPSDNLSSLPEGLIVCGSAFLDRTKITSLPEDLVVGGSLYLPQSIRKLPRGMVVGGSLGLSNTKITSLPGDLVVGGTLYLPPNVYLPKSIHVHYNIYVNSEADMEIVYPEHKRFQEGEYEPGRYLFADGKLKLVRRAKVMGNYTYYVGKIPNKNVITDGNNYALCSSFKKGIAALEYKAAKDREADQYKGIDPDTEMGVPELMTMYRVITGACQHGTEQFVQSLQNLKSKYTIREVIEMTEGHYGASTFKKFFQ